MSASVLSPAPSRRRAHFLCRLQDLVPDSGVAALLGTRQIAVFYLPGAAPEVHALDNYDPIGRANVLARGIVGDIAGEPVVASPLYKQHFSLRSGQCVEQPDISIPRHDVLVSDGYVYLAR